MSPEQTVYYVFGMGPAPPTAHPRGDLRTFGISLIDGFSAPDPRARPLQGNPQHTLPTLVRRKTAWGKVLCMDLRG